jgi:hypothetical protein
MGVSDESGFQADYLWMIGRVALSDGKEQIRCPEL